MAVEPSPAPQAPGWAAAISAVFRHQLRLLVHSRLTLVFQLGFLIALPVAAFLVGDVFAADRASLDLMIGFLPWIALIFVPALAMRTFADRSVDREREFLLTLPLPATAIAFGAWLAGAAILLLTLAFTAPFAATICYLGAPDPGVMAAGYVAAACLLVAFYAIGLFASAVARSEIGAFMIALAILFLLLMSGWDGVGRLTAGAARSLEVAAYASPKFWAERLATGDLQLKGVAYFALLTALSLGGAAAALRARREGGFGRRVLWFAGGGAAAALALAVVAAIPSRLAVDLTEDQAFTMSAATIEAARRLPPGSRIDLYWSAGGADIPEPVRAHARRVSDLLELVADRSNGRVRFRAHDAAEPGVGITAEAAGARRVPLSSGGAFHLGAAFVSGDRKIPIGYFDLSREALLEYDVATALAGLGRPRALKVGVMTSLLAPGDATEALTGLAAVAELRRAYDVAVLSTFADRLPDGLDALVAIGAGALKPEMLRSIDGAAMRGMGLVVLLDPRLRLSPASDVASPGPSEAIDDVSDLLARYGLRYLGDEVVGDARLATPVADASGKPIAYPFWMRFGRGEISRTDSSTAGLSDLLLVEPGALVGQAAKALVSTTEGAGATPRRDMADRTPAALAAAFAPQGGRRVVAAEIDGPFESAFPTPASVEGAGRPDRSPKASRVFAVADVDWILDPFAYEPSPDPSAPRKPANDNVALFLNLVERAAGGGALASIRARGTLKRPLTRVADVARAASRADGERPAAAMTRIAEVEKRIAALPAAAGVADFEALPPELLARVAEFRAALAPDREVLRALETRERAAIEALKSRTILFNLAAGPALALGFAGLVALARTRKRRGRARAGWRLD